MRLRLIIAIGRLGVVVVRWQHLRKWVMLLETALHHTWLVASVVKVAVSHRKSELWRFHVVVPICHRVSLPVLWDLHFWWNWIFLDYKLVVVWITWRRCSLIYHIALVFERWDQVSIPLLLLGKCLVHQLLTRRPNWWWLVFLFVLPLVVTSFKVEARAFAKATLLSLFEFKLQIAYANLAFPILDNLFAGDVISSLIFLGNCSINGWCSIHLLLSVHDWLII